MSLKFDTGEEDGVPEIHSCTFVIPNGARNLSWDWRRGKKERFLAPLGMTERDAEQDTALDKTWCLAKHVA